MNHLNVLNMIDTTIAKVQKQLDALLQCRRELLEKYERNR